MTMTERNRTIKTDKNLLLTELMFHGITQWALSTTELWSLDDLDSNTVTVVAANTVAQEHCGSYRAREHP